MTPGLLIGGLLVLGEPLSTLRAALTAISRDCPLLHVIECGPFQDASRNRGERTGRQRCRVRPYDRSERAEATGA